MGFATAIRVVLSKYVDFTGRARRSEFWWFALFTVIVSAIGAALDAGFGTDFGDDPASSGLIQGLASLALVLPTIAVTIRRLHDTGRVGWWYLIVFVPLIGWLVLVVFCVLDSQPGKNKYGSNPKETNV